MGGHGGHHFAEHKALGENRGTWGDMGASFGRAWEDMGEQGGHGLAKPGGQGTWVAPPSRAWGTWGDTGGTQGHCLAESEQLGGTWRGTRGHHLAELGEREGMGDITWQGQILVTRAQFRVPQGGKFGVPTPPHCPPRLNTSATSPSWRWWSSRTAGCWRCWTRRAWPRGPSPTRSSWPPWMPAWATTPTTPAAR